MYEGYTHMANLFLSRTEYADTLLNESGKFLTAIRKSTAAQRRSPAAILLFGFRTPCAEAAADGGKIKTVYENFYKTDWKISDFNQSKLPEKCQIRCDNLFGM